MKYFPCIPFGLNICDASGVIKDAPNGEQRKPLS